MNILKQIVHAMSTSALSFSLFMLASTTILTITILHAPYLKTVLHKSNVYQNLVPATVNLAIASSTPNTSSDSLDPQTMRQLEPVLVGAISPQFLQTTSEAVINGGFAWLQGSVAVPNFAVKTLDVKASLHSGLVDFIQNRLASLPVCPRGTNTNNSDPLSATCKPRLGVSAAEIDQNVSTLADKIPLFQKEDVSLQSLGATDAFAVGKPIQKAPLAYNILTKLPYAFAGLILLCSLILVLIGVEKYRSWRTIGHTFAWAGILLVISSAVALFFANKVTNKLLGGASAEQAHFAAIIITPITKQLTSSVAYYSLYFGAGYCLIGAVCYVIAHRLRRSLMTSNQSEIKPESNAKTALTQGI